MLVQGEVFLISFKQKTLQNLSVMFMYLYIYLFYSVFLSVYLSFFLVFLFPSMHLLALSISEISFIYLYFYLSIYLSVHVHALQWIHGLTTTTSLCECSCERVFTTGPEMTEHKKSITKTVRWEFVFPNYSGRRIQYNDDDILKH